MRPEMTEHEFRHQILTLLESIDGHLSAIRFDELGTLDVLKDIRDAVE